MKQLLSLALAFCTVATPALAERQVYLQDGGMIRAKSVWRSDGKVHVLANRDTLIEFYTAEIDMKRTFAPKRRIVLKPASHVTHAAIKQAESKQKLSLPSLPKLTEQDPESLMPSSGNVGVIRKQKKEMAEKLGE